MAEIFRNESLIKISIIIPVYNVNAYLQECLESILNQDLKEIEVICINDGSTDNSLEILKNYQKKDSRIIIINQENKGQGEARNAGIEAGKGEYLFFVDPDDYIEGNTLSKVYSFAKENNSDIVWFDYRTFNEYSGEVKEKKFPEYLSLKKQEAKELNKIFPATSYPVWNRIFKTDFIKKNHIKFPKTKTFEDGIFSTIATITNKRTDYIPLFVYCYRERAGSITHTNDDKGLGVFEAIKQLEEFLKSYNLYNEYKKGFENYKLTCFIGGFYLISDNLKKKYIKEVRENLSGKDFNRFIKCITQKRSFLENIFSVKNNFIYFIKYKIVTFLGMSFSFRVKNQDSNEFTTDLKFQIIPIDRNNKNAFCFAINDSYVKYFGVVLKSLIENSSKNKTYDIVVFSEDITVQNKERLESMLPKNFSLRFFDMNSYIKTKFGKLQLKANETWPLLVFYRCFIPFIMEYYDKVLYIDGDTLINKNIDNIFDINLEGKQIGVCTDVVSVMEEDLKNPHNKFQKEVLKIENAKDYFNSGVILFDIKKIDTNEYFEKFVTLVNGKKYMCPDQDALNLIFREKTKVIPFKYNCQYANCIYNKTLEKKVLTCYKQQIIEAIQDPYIIHFLIKPWNTTKYEWGKLFDRFWEYAKKTSFYEEILLSSISQIYINEINSKDKKLSLLENIFSIKNEYTNGNKYKVITLFGKKKKKYIAG